MSNLVYNPPIEPWLDILYRDRDIVIVNKPSGLLSVPGRVNTDSVLERLKQQEEHCYAAHRLDMDTSGLMIFALRRKAERNLHEQFRQRAVDKTYVAVVDGVVTPNEGLIDVAIRREGGLPPRSFVDPELGKPAQTRFKALKILDMRTLVCLYPKTGRSHQLRVHMAHMGHPIVGDRIYHPQPERDQRLMLHAYELSFYHPYSQHRMVFRCQPELEFMMDESSERKYEH